MSIVDFFRSFTFAVVEQVSLGGGVRKWRSFTEEANCQDFEDNDNDNDNDRFTEEANCEDMGIMMTKSVSRKRIVFASNFVFVFLRH